MDIRLLTNARVAGVLRSPAEGVIAAPAADARRLIDAGMAEDPNAKAPKKGAAKKPAAARRARPSTKAVAAEVARPPVAPAPAAPARADDAS